MLIWSSLEAYNGFNFALNNKILINIYIYIILLIQGCIAKMCMFISFLNTNLRRKILYFSC